MTFVYLYHIPNQSYPFFVTTLKRLKIFIICYAKLFNKNNNFEIYIIDN